MQYRATLLLLSEELCSLPAAWSCSCWPVLLPSMCCCSPAPALPPLQAELLEWLVKQPQDCQRVVYADQQLASGILEGMSRLGLY